MQWLWIRQINKPQKNQTKQALIAGKVHEFTLKDLKLLKRKILWSHSWIRKEYSSKPYSSDQNRMKERLLKIQQEKYKKAIVKKFLSLLVILLTSIKMIHWENKKRLSFFRFHQKRKNRQQTNSPIILWEVLTWR